MSKQNKAKQRMKHSPSASATPETKPAHTVTTERPTHPLKTFPPSALPPLNVLDTPASQDHVKLSLIGPKYAQNPAATAAPVSEAAMKPARLLRGARGRPRSRAGSGGVSEPQRRPKVDAAVSAQERLLEHDEQRIIKQRKVTYIRIETTAMSRGNAISAVLAPRIYHITPLDDF